VSVDLLSCPSVPLPLLLSNVEGHPQIFLMLSLISFKFVEFEGELLLFIEELLESVGKHLIVVEELAVLFIKEIIRVLILTIFLNAQHLLDV